MGIPTVVANQVFALVGNVLRDFGQEVQGTEDLEVAFRSTSQVRAGRAGETAAVVRFRAVDDRAFVGRGFDPLLPLSMVLLIAFASRGLAWARTWHAANEQKIPPDAIVRRGFVQPSILNRHLPARRPYSAGAAWRGLWLVLRLLWFLLLFADVLASHDGFLSTGLVRRLRIRSRGWPTSPGKPATSAANVVYKMPS